MGQPLKIAIVVPDNRDESRRYDDLGPHFGTAVTALLDGFTLLADECEIHVVNCVQRPVATTQRIAPNIFYHTEVVPKWGWLRGGYLGCIRSLRRQLQKIQPDIVHGQGTERYCALGAVFSGFPNVVTIHGNMKAIAEFFHARPGSFHWLTARLETLALHRTSGVFCNSTYTELQVAPRTRQIWRVANALRQDFFSPVPDPKTKALPVILNVGSALPYKRQLELLDVAHRLHQSGIKLEWQFAGKLDGPTAYQAALARALAVGEQAGYARQLGSLSTSQLIAAMDAASALVHFPSEEAFGLVVAEALARNLKFFGAATGGVVDIATGAEGAELIPAQDFTHLETALADWQQAGCPQPQSAAQTMRERYHPLVIAREHLRVYREVLEKF